MQFVANGPDVPESLLQAHEEGRVVFFCGAGISYPAGLPLFKGLVRDIYDRLGTSMQALEQSAFNKDQYDLTLDLLEHRHRGGRLAVRRELANALKPNLRRPGATTTHESLLHLARDREGALRLLTTNFDRIFEMVAKRLKLPHQAFSAPMLPIPKSSRWDGLVYLHGLQPSQADDAALHRLVVTSGDFGLAYLTERWAARFVTDLFRNYVVCFVGYSINDPVLRYMMDALAADRMLGEQTPQAYAFGACQPGAEAANADDWRAKGVEPILYTTPANAKGQEDHSALPKTLHAWSRTYREGALGKESIVTAHALTNPSENTPQDDFVGRMLWALSDPRGLPAKRFAEMQPVPPITWLEAFSEKRFRHGDLPRFGVPPHAFEDRRLRFSLTSRPAPYQHAPWMALGGYPGWQSDFDPIMQHLARWITRHLNDPHCLLWLLGQGPQPHPALAWAISQELNAQAQLISNPHSPAPETADAGSPTTIASPTMRTLWGVYLNGRIKHASGEVDIYNWMARFKYEGLTALLRSQLRELLSPRLVVRKSWRSIDLDEQSDERGLIKQSIDWELTLVADQLHHQLGELHELRLLAPVLPSLLVDLQQLLCEALALMVELGDANSYSDRSYWDLPSIMVHDQNSEFRTWVILIELLRDAWIEIRKVDAARATWLAQDWFSQPFASFKRLALFAASHDDVIAPSTWVSWLLADRQRWLWVPETMRECMRLLVLQGAKLQPEDQARLEAAILDGPPRNLFRDDTPADTWSVLTTHATWLHLAKLEFSGLMLGRHAKLRLDQLAMENPHFRLAPNESDEFSHWSGSTQDGIDNQYREPNPAPATRQGLIDWLRRQAAADTGAYETSWPERCRTRLYRCASALKALAAENIWPATHWRDALQAWSDDALALRSWKCLAPIVMNMPDATFVVIAHAVSRWLDGAAKSLDGHDLSLLALCERVLAMAHVNHFELDEPLTQAINHPVGHVTQALVAHWFKRDPQDNDGLPQDIEPFFTQIADIARPQLRHGRVILASRLIALFRVDQTWTTQHLLPNFDWDINADEALAAWSGFMWSARRYAPLLATFKKQLLATTQHYAKLDDRRSRFVAFLTYVALDPIEDYSTQDFQNAFSKLPEEGLHQVVQTLVQAQEAAGERRVEFWRNRLYPFWQRVWPKDRHFASADISVALARLCVAAGDEFPSAVHAVSDWLVQTENWGYVVRSLHKSGLDTRFPLESLTLLSAIVSERSWPPSELRETLNALIAAKPHLAGDARHIRLSEYVRSRAM